MKPENTQADLSSAANRSQNPKLFWIFISFLLPMLLSNLLQSLSGTLNNVYVGHLMGKEAIAALASFFPIIFLLISVTIGIGAGASVLIGQAWGAGDKEKVRAVSGTTLTVILALGCVFAVIGALSLDQLLALLGTPQNIIADAKVYAYVMLFSVPGIFLFIAFTSMLRGTGDTVTPLWALFVSTIIGLILTPIFILGWFGLPEMGIASPAIATFFANTLTMIWLFLHIKKRNHVLSIDRTFLPHFRIRFGLLRIITKISIPMTIQMITIALSELAIIRFINDFGSDATASYGALIQIIGYVQFPAISIAITVSILGAQAIGRNQLYLLSQITRIGLFVNLVLTGGLIALTYLLSKFIIGFFITDHSVLLLTDHLLHISLWSIILFGFSRVFASIMQASGVVYIPMMINIFCIVAVELPLAWWLSQHYGLQGVWLSYPATFIVMLILQFLYYWFIWRKMPIKRLI